MHSGATNQVDKNTVISESSQHLPTVHLLLRRGVHLPRPLTMLLWECLYGPEELREV